MSVLGLLALKLVAAQEAPPTGAELYRLCAQCHGPAGHGNREIGAPGLTALEPWYFARQLRNFRAGSRGQPDQDVHQPTMELVSRTVEDDAAIPRLYEYVDSLPEYVPPESIVADSERGRQLYEACDSCHGAAGEGSEALNAPGLAYRDDWYLRAQIEAFVSGERGSHPDDMFGQQMVPVSRVVTNTQAVLDLVAYINTLR